MSTALSRDRRLTELREFLRSRRERLTPADVGLPNGGRRRTPGLRREEVAVLAGVGVSWYTWLEQGRDIKVSDDVLDAVARTLLLDEAERVMGNASGAADVGISANELWFTNKTVSGFNLAAFSAAHPEAAVRALRRAVAATAGGDLRVQVEIRPWEQVVEVHRRIETEATAGKIVLAVGA